MKHDAIGSLDLAPKHNRSWGDDMTTTRAGKWAAAAGGINLRDPVRSIRRHDHWRIRAAVLIVGCGVLLGLTVVMVWRMVP
jgi:hypothetical protein